MGRIIERIATAWCKFAHPEPFWPIAGKYICRVCHRVHRVAWSNE